MRMKDRRSVGSSVKVCKGCWRPRFWYREDQIEGPVATPEARVLSSNERETASRDIDPGAWSVKEGDRPSQSVMKSPNILPDRSSYPFLLPQRTFGSPSNVVNKEDVLKDTTESVHHGYIDRFKATEVLELGTEFTVVLDELASLGATEW
jgi:hypothetical protein